MDIEFKRPQLEDKELIQSYLRQSGLRGCERTFGNLYLWARFYHVTWAKIEDTLVFRSDNEYGISYTCPMGPGDHKAVVELLLADSREKGYPFRLQSVTVQEMEELEQNFPGKFQIEWSRDDADYVYETEKLITLAGKKYHGKKNHINQFKAAYPDWSYEPLNDENVEECFQMALNWRRENGCEDDEEKNAEMCATLNSLRLYKELDFRGGLIRAGGRVVAFSVGEPVNDDTFNVHFEKAYADVRGAYTIINQQFLEHEVKDFTYVNREEDVGEEGLRKAKLSYHPVFMVEKGIVTLKEKEA